MGPRGKMSGFIKTDALEFARSADPAVAAAVIAQLAEACPHGLVCCDESRTVLFASEPAFRAFGLDTGTCFPQIQLTQMFGPEIGPTLARLADRLVNERLERLSQAFAISVKGIRVELTVTALPLGRGCGFVVQSPSLDEAALEALQESTRAMSRLAEQQRLILETASDFIYEQTPDGRFTYASPAVRRVVGYEPEELTGHYTNFLTDHPFNKQAIFYFDQAVITGKKQPVYLLECKTKTGGTVYLEINEEPVVRDGVVVGVVGIARDVTERQIALENLQASEERFRTYIDMAPYGILIADRTGHIVECNQAATRLTGYVHDELLRMTCSQITAKGSDSVESRFGELHQTGHSSGESTFRCRDESLIEVSLDAVLLESGNVMVHFADITETNRLRRLENRAQRLETAGQVAGQVAHDFNNLLAPLVSYPELIRDSLTVDHPALTYLTSIEKAAARIADINQQLLTLGRRGHFHEELVNLNEIAAQVVQDTKITDTCPNCILNLGEPLQHISGSAAQLHRVIANLLVNARDAVVDNPAGNGRIVVTTENVTLTASSDQNSSLPAGQFVRLSVSDNGCGIAPADLERIFDPFFTTKKTDRRRGSGLGLSVVNSVVQDHGGHIDVSSRRGEGTTFSVYFPARAKNSTSTGAPVSDSEKVRSRS